MSLSRDISCKLASSNNENAENTCVVCFKNVEIFSIGECDHPVCYECSTRMRVLCQQNECPICRQGLSKVIFTNEKKSYRELEANNRSEYYNKKYKICFANIQIQKAFYDLLDHPCPKCECPPFRSFDALRHHVRGEHEMFYCDICTENLKIFSFERKCYNRQDLGLHRRKGDPDNTSHRGHPLCQYCERRYLDRDELFRHLRREHYYCHFCDADGTNEFYPDYNHLREHFRQKHFLCEEGDCAREQFTAVFRSDIDLKAHIANVHGKSLGKQQVKQARTLQLEITLGPRGRATQPDQIYTNIRPRSNEEAYETENNPPSTGVSSQPKMIDAQNEQEFPSLSGTGSVASSTVTLIRPNMSMLAKSSSGLARTKENFPALGGETNSGRDRTEQQKVNQSKHPAPKSVSSLLKGNSNATRTGNTAPGGMVIHVSNRPSVSNSRSQPYEQLFPALPGSSRNHHQQHLNLQEDLSYPTSQINLKTSVSSKHRSLMDEYVSVANPANKPKISVIQKEQLSEKKLDNFSAPKLNNDNFPALSSKAMTISPAETGWVKTQKQHELENRKSKIAPPPFLNGNDLLQSQKRIEKKESAKQTKSTEYENNNSNNNNKKDKRMKTADKRNLDTKRSDTLSIKTSKSSMFMASKEKLGNNEKSISINVQNKQHQHNGDNANGNLNITSETGAEPVPPPGFNNANSNNTKLSTKQPPPPPGFQNVVTLNSVAKSPNNLTFTSSLGESYKIVPNHQYIPPPNSTKRNQELVTLFQSALEQHEAVQEFKHISQKFREGQYKPLPYYEHCLAALKDTFDEVFPELLALLPDINKQQELYLVHSQYSKENSKNRRTNQKSKTKLEVCSTCKQVLKSNDLKSHMKEHSLENNFPPLQSNKQQHPMVANSKK